VRFVFQVIAVLFAANTALAQLPKGTYAWWSSPVVQNLNLSDEQRKQIRQTIKEYRPRLLELRAAVERAETDLEREFNQPAVDTRRASETIDRFASARGDLTRTLSQMSLKLRTVLKPDQWDELQRRRPARSSGKQSDQSQQ
jgi:Spy/CpxP family protein refolding chaperone